MTKYDEALLDEAKKLNKSDFLTLAKWYISSDNGECLSVFDIDTNATEGVIYIDCFRDDTEETELWVVALDEKVVDKEIIEASNPGYSNYNSICFND